MAETLIPVERLQAVADNIWDSVTTREQTYPIDMNDNSYGMAFRYYLFFSQRPLLIKAGFGELSDEILFYNRYYWFLRFSKLLMASRGYDAGLEQQAFQLLEQSNCNMDWSVIETISTRVTEELKQHGK